MILDRDRHDDIIRQCREAGARIKLIQDGDVAGAITVGHAPAAAPTSSSASAARPKA